MRPGQWDSYLCQGDHKLASIFLDLALQKAAPVKALPHMAYIRLHMMAPREDGLSSSEEFAQLSGLEDSLEAVLCREQSTLFVGRNTSDGCRDFYFYIDDPKDWADRVTAAMRPYSDYRYQYGTRPDIDWKTYLEFLFPPDIELQRMANSNVCYSLKDKGDTLTEPRDVRHWVYLPTESARSHFIDYAVAGGFMVQERPVIPRKLSFGLCLSRLDIPSFGNIDQITLPLYEKALELKGAYDGWEAVVIPSTESAKA
jgi:hypothetical protein